MTVVASKYELLEMAGEGGMAKVWRAVMRWAAGFSRQVAVKQILPNLTSNRKFVAMFIEEARVGYSSSTRTSFRFLTSAWTSAEPISW